MITGATFSGATILGTPDTVSNSVVSLGTTFAWTSNTYFDSWTSQTSATTDLPTTGGPSTVNSGYNTNQLVWQVFYAHAAVTLAVGSNTWGFVPYLNGTNSVSLRGSVSTVNDTLGSFAADSVIAVPSGSTSYTAAVLSQKAISTAFSVPANRYFLIGMVGGPFYRMFKNLANNRTATVSGNPIVTVLNKFYLGRWTDGPATGIPTQLGGAATFTEVTGNVPVLSFKFTTA